MQYNSIYKKEVQTPLQDSYGKPIMRTSYPKGRSVYEKICNDEEDRELKIKYIKDILHLIDFLITFDTDSRKLNRDIRRAETIEEIKAVLNY